MKEGFSFAVIPDIQLGYLSYCLWDRLVYLWDQLIGRVKEGVVGEEIEKRLLSAASLINSISEIKFVMTVGDLAQGGQLEGRLKVKEILDGLKVPWVPVLGNHELLPYTKTIHWGGESKGIKYFEEIFKENFQFLSNFFENWEKPQSEELLANYGFTYQSTRFIVVDNVNRRQTPLSKRTQQIFLRRESKEWLREQLSKKEERKIIFSHSPLNPWLLKRLSDKAGFVNIAGHWHEELKLRYPKTSITTFITSTLYLKPVIIVVKVLPDEIQFHSERIP